MPRSCPSAWSSLRSSILGFRASESIHLTLLIVTRRPRATDDGRRPGAKDDGRTTDDGGRKTDNERRTKDDGRRSRATDDERRTTDDGRRKTDDERRTKDDGRPSRATDDERRTTEDGRRRRTTSWRSLIHKTCKTHKAFRINLSFSFTNL